MLYSQKTSTGFPRVVQTLRKRLAASVDGIHVELVEVSLHAAN